VLEVREVPDPEPASDEVVVGVRAVGVNRADLLQRLGRYPAPEGYPPDIPGLEVAGVVETVGADVRDRGPGDRVMGVVAGGGYAERVAVPSDTLVPVPDALDLVSAAAVPEVFMTAFDAVFLQEGLRAGETLLVHAVGSGVGTAAVQLARRAGARSVGTSRTPEKLERARELGLDVAVVADEGWPDTVLDATDGEGADVILDLVGGPYLAGNQRVLASRGRHIVVGVTGGATAEIDLRRLMGRRGSIRGTVLRARSVAEKALLARAFESQVLPGFADDTLAPVVDRTFPAADAGDAHRYMESNRSFGKILLTW
jgi:putative PIG3 family NAD(P)H quinone oxidoreductase